MEVSGDLVVGDGLVMLGGDEDSVNADWDGGTVLDPILDGHLGLAVGPHPLAGAILPDLQDAQFRSQKRELRGQSGTRTERMVVSKRCKHSFSRFL
jgi:hypothetical protein